MLLSIYADVTAGAGARVALEHYRDAGGEFWSLLLTREDTTPMFRLDHLSRSLLEELGRRIGEAIAGK